jgi:DNA polymerase III subunit epsilon
MREIVLDTETTGLDPDQGDRIVEIGGVELLNHLPTGRTFHVYLNPERAMSADAEKVHGLSDAFLADKPLFRAVAADFLAFIADAHLVIHNAAFDMKFLNAELRWANLPQLPWERAVDTLAIARRKFPGAPASLDALCRRFGIDNSTRTLHGALLDSQILAEVYLELIGGRQPDFGLTSTSTQTARTVTTDPQGRGPLGPRPAPLPPRLTESERAAHAEFVGTLGPKALWLSES